MTVDLRPDDPGWWRDATIYQVYVRSFADSDGDGIGDLPGVRAKLPYLRDLGVDALWLTPFYTSPMVDGGYDVANYRDVDPIFGTLRDAEDLIGDAHHDGLRIIVDIVPNHTSDRHAWFVEALATGPGSKARDRYVFRTGRGTGGEAPPNDWQSVFGGPAWTRVTEAGGTPGQWYLHIFDTGQPDLNWASPDVHAEFESILRFWLDRGVDGFRIDVAHGLVKAEGLPDVGQARTTGLLGADELPYFDQDGVHEIYRQWRKILDAYPGTRIAVAEAWTSNTERLALYVRPDELHQAFNFSYLTTPWSAPAFRTVIDNSLATATAVGASPTWVLSNHDVQRHVTRYGGGKLGLRRARAAALLTLALPGSAYLYQGEELGLPEVTDLPDEVLQDPTWRRSGHTERGRDGCRVPMPWSGDRPPFGFEPPGSARTWLPQPPAWSALTVERQRGDARSVLSLYCAALRHRPTLDAGPLRWIPVDHPDVLAFTRGDSFACAVNFGNTPAEIRAPDMLAAPGTLAGPGILAAPETPAGPRTLAASETPAGPRTLAALGTLVLVSAPGGRLDETAHGVKLPPATAAWWNMQDDPARVR